MPLRLLRLTLAVTVVVTCAGRRVSRLGLQVLGLSGADVLQPLARLDALRLKGNVLSVAVPDLSPHPALNPSPATRSPARSRRLSALYDTASTSPSATSPRWPKLVVHVDQNSFQNSQGGNLSGFVYLGG